MKKHIKKAVIGLSVAIISIVPAFLIGDYIFISKVPDNSILILVPAVVFSILSISLMSILNKKG